MSETSDFEALRELLAPAIPARYVLGRGLGRGGMGVVFAGRDQVLGRTIAFKVIPDAPEQQATRRNRFLQEARIAASLLHPNIVPVFDAGESAGHLWYTMGLIEGTNLRQLIEQTGPLGLEQGLVIAMEVGQAVAYAHARGVVHRDVKPENVMIERSSGRAYLCDFGIAKIEDPDWTKAETSMLICSPLYAAPEQLLEESPATARSDQYALSLLTCFILAGVDPVPRTSVGQIIRRYVEGWTPGRDAMTKEWPSALRHVIGTGLSRLPQDRYESVESWMLALRSAVPSTGRSPIVVEKFLDETESFIAATGALLLGLGMGGLFGVFAVAPSLFAFAFGALAYGWALRLVEVRRAGFDFASVRSALRTERRRRDTGGGSRAGIVLRFALLFILGALPQIGLVLAPRSTREQILQLFPLTGLAGLALLLFLLRFWSRESGEPRVMLSRIVSIYAVTFLLLGVALAIAAWFTPAREYMPSFLPLPGGIALLALVLAGLARWIAPRRRGAAARPIDPESSSNSDSVASS